MHPSEKTLSNQTSLKQSSHLAKTLLVATPPEQVKPNVDSTSWQRKRMLLRMDLYLGFMFPLRYLIMFRLVLVVLVLVSFTIFPGFGAGIFFPILWFWC